ncbi:unnamed protein product [Sphagnum troendelagicum]|uniref:Uncharacterized protein n=1 Tax=Sphagnum troendelagicum TaxID=128251 RepID=A0ABP0TZJ3_9BRYO
MPCGGFPSVHPSMPLRDPLFVRFEVIEIPSQDVVVRVRGGLIEFALDLSPFGRGARGIDVQDGERAVVWGLYCDELG